VFSGARESQVMGGGQLTALKFGADVRNCIWRSCRTGVKVMAMTTCCWLSHISTISRGGKKINASCYMLPPAVEKWFPHTCMLCAMLTFSTISAPHKFFLMTTMIKRKLGNLICATAGISVFPSSDFTDETWSRVLRASLRQLATLHSLPMSLFLQRK